MAAVTELSFLLFVLINNIHAEELFVIGEESRPYTFYLPTQANSCLISKFVGEEKLVLLNTSDLWNQNSTLPEDLKHRFRAFSLKFSCFWVIFALKRSDSGLYQEECWTEGKVTHEKNISVIICSSIEEQRSVSVRCGRTVDLPCFGAAGNLDFLWLKYDFGYHQGSWTRVVMDSNTPVTDSDKGRYQVVKNTSALRASSLTTAEIIEFTCLVMNQQQCVSSHPVRYNLDGEVIYGSEGESAVLPCTVTDFSHDRPPLWTKDNSWSKTDLGQENQTVYSVDQNYSLVFSSLMLNHSGWYYCQTMWKIQTYLLVVCPTFVPPTVELFSEGEEVTLRCKVWEKDVESVWFINSTRTEGSIFNVMSNLSMSRVSWYPDGSLVISNVSLNDSGEYWCAVADQYGQCVSTSKTLLTFGVHSTFYTVRCSLLSVLPLMLCAVVVAVNRRTRTGTRRLVFS